MRPAAHTVFHFEGHALDVTRGCLMSGQGEVELRPKSFAVLRYLVENADRLVSKEEMIKAVWPGVFVTDDSLTQCVREVRLALGDRAQRIIKTVPRRGYRFAAPVSGSGSAAGGLAARSVAPRLSIAVLPFANIGSDPDQEHVADGLTDSLTTDLSRIPGSLVIARHSAFTYKGKAVDAKEVGRELGVRYLLEGSVQRGGDRIRVNAQLIDAQTGMHVWAERYDRDFADVDAGLHHLAKHRRRCFRPPGVRQAARAALCGPAEAWSPGLTMGGRWKAARNASQRRSPASGARKVAAATR